MNKTKYISLVFFASLVATLFFACKKTHDMPPVQPSTIGGTLTIAQLRALYNGQNIKFTQDVSLFATVTMSDNYKTLFVRDNTGSITVKQITAHGIFEGDSLRINLNGATLDLSGNLSSLQIDSLDVSSSPTNKVVKLAVGKEHSPVTVSIAQLNKSTSTTFYTTPVGGVTLPLSVYDGELVQINNVQFAYNDASYFIPLNNPPLFVNHNLYDCGAYNFINMSLYSNTNDFLYRTVPYTKSGSIVAAVTFYNGALQLTPRSYKDLVFNQPRCGVDTLTQSFNNTAFGTQANFTSTLFPGWLDIKQTGAGTSIDWQGTSSATTPSYNFPSASAHISSGNPNSRNVVWLISPPIENSPTKTLNFQAATAYNSAGKRQLSVLISTDFNGTNFPTSATSATWIDISSNFTISTVGSISTFTFFDGGTVSLNSVASNLSGYNGTFYVGFRFTGNQNDSTASYAFKDVKIRN
ncbi:MAG: DUF5689 domain-containing protein [Bacteroidia bacterium]